MSLISGASLVIGRVIEEQKNAYIVQTEEGVIRAKASGRMQHAAKSRLELPAVGDFVQLEVSSVSSQESWHLIDAILPRKSQLIRKAAGGPAQEQIIATNVDVVFIVMSLNQDLNERRLERYLLAVWDSGAVPVVILSKADLESDREAAMSRILPISMGAQILVVSASTGEGVHDVTQLLQNGRTGVFVGSSGVGKSTLINALLEEKQVATQAIRESDDRGRHTTTSRKLWKLGNGGVIIDTPGMREFMPWVEEETVDAAFSDVESLILTCRFSNCTHGNEPGCAILMALAEGSLDQGRFKSYQKMLREQAFLDRKAMRQRRVR